MMRSSFRGLFFFSLATAMVAGCNSHDSPSVEKFDQDQVEYPAVPTGVARPRVAVPAPAVELIAGTDEADHSVANAYDALFWAAGKSGRFNLVSHQRLDEILSQQGASGVLQSGALAHPTPIHGIDLLLLSSIHDVYIAGEPPPSKASVGGLESLLHLKKAGPKIVITCVVDLQLVDPATGTTAAQVRDSFNRISSPESMGLSFDSPDAASGKLHLTDEQLHQVMRVVLDDAMHKFVPDTDRALANLQQPATPKTAQVPHGNTVAVPPATKPAAMAKIQCPDCGFLCSPDDEFCPNCGHRLPHKGSQGAPAAK